MRLTARKDFINRRKTPAEIIRKWLYKHLEKNRLLGTNISILNLVSIACIILATSVQFLETEITFFEKHRYFIITADYFFALFFTTEFILRFWSASENPWYVGFSGRMAYITRPTVFIDLLTTLPFIFAIIFPQYAIFRLLRIFRIISITKFGKFNKAFYLITTSLKERKGILIASFLIPFFLAILSATILYWVEKDMQPEVFGSIPRAFWWAIITITTVGYGDVVPITVLGKILGSFIAFMGMISMTLPAGIISGAVSHAYTRSKEEKNKKEWI